MRIEAIGNLTKVEDCERVMERAAGIDPKLFNAAIRRIAELGGRDHADPAEADAYSAMHAYESLRRRKQKGFRANRTWPMIKREGILAAFDRLVTKGATAGFDWLIEHNLPELTAEYVILKWPTRFSDAAVKVAAERLAAHDVAFAS